MNEHSRNRGGEAEKASNIRAARPGITIMQLRDINAFTTRSVVITRPLHRSPVALTLSAPPPASSASTSPPPPHAHARREMEIGAVLESCGAARPYLAEAHANTCSSRLYGATVKLITPSLEKSSGGSRREILSGCASESWDGAAFWAAFVVGPRGPLAPRLLGRRRLGNAPFKGSSF